MMELMKRLGLCCIKQDFYVLCTRTFWYAPSVQRTLNIRPYCSALSERSRTFPTDKPDVLCEIPAFQSSLSEEQLSCVLQVLNTADVTELTNYKLSKTRAKNLVAFRNRYGNFSDLSTIMHVEDFGVQLVNKLCERIISGDKKVTRIEDTDGKQTRAWSQLIHPAVPEDQRETITSVTGVEMTPTSLSWARLNLQTNLVTDWGCSQLFVSEKKIKQPVILEMAHRIHSEIPRSDVYAFEEKSFRTTQQKFSALNQQMKQLQVMLFALLNVPFSSSNPVHRVFVVKPVVLTHLFQIKVGSERVSTQHITEDMIKRYRKSLYSPSLNLNVEEGENNHSVYTPVSWESPELSQVFSKVTVYDREYLSNALLIAASFADLAVRQKTEVVELLKRVKQSPKRKSSES